MAERKVTQAIRDSRGRILALCHPRAAWSPRRAPDAIRDIHYGLHRYVAVLDGKKAEVRVVSGPYGAYLRTDWDDTEANNLDDLPSATAGNPLTGLSEVALQVREPVVEQLARAMHRAGIIGHQALWSSGDQVVELVFGAPESITLLPTEEDETEARARLDIPVLYRSRPMESADELGETASARLHVRARVASRADPTGVQLLIDWSETQDEDVDVAGQNDGTAAKVIAAYAREQGKRGQDVRLPGFTGSAWLSELTTSFRRYRGENLVAVTLSFGSAAPEQAEQVDGRVFLDRDWALALSEHLVTQRIRDGLQHDLGALPPPFGPDPVVLPGTTDLYLDSFEASLGNGAIVFKGELRRQATPVVTASYSAEIDLSLTGGRVQATVGTVKVKTHEWYAALADFFSGGAISGAVERGIRQSLGSSAGGRMTTLFSSELLREVASVGSNRTIDAEPVLEELEVRPEGVVVQGSVEVADLDAPPVAVFDVLPSRRGPRWRILHAGGSWAPGGRPASFSWAFGDGDEEELSGAHTSFVLEHEYPAGTFTARLTVTDDHGATASAAQIVEVE